ANGISAIGFQTNSVPFGPSLTVVPSVSSDGFAIQMSLSGQVTEFLGYDDAGRKTWEGKPVIHSQQRFRTRELLSNVNVWDGQTVLLGPVGANKSSPNRKSLFLFVTATIIDSSGNRVHSEEQLPFATNSVPVQPEQK
ncbi:MAG: hypothetical protein ABIV39_17345, partial [Verrucomicrobiota bacterium]